MKLLTIYLIIIIFCRTISPFVKKIISSRIGTDEFIIIQTTVFSVLVYCYYLYIHKYKRKLDFSPLKKYTINDYALLLFITLTSVLSVVIFIRLINMTEVTYLIPQVQCIIIALTFIIGYLIFNESFSIRKGIGIFFIILGILLMNMRKKIFK